MAVVETLSLDLDDWSVWYPSDMPPLTTFFTPDRSCSTKWIQDPFDHTAVRSGFLEFTQTRLTGSETGPWTVSTYAGHVPVDWYSSCRPYSRPPFQAYSPGICTSDQTLAAIVEYQYNSSRFWGGSCCDSGMTMSQDLFCTKVFTTPVVALVNFTTTLVYSFDTTPETRIVPVIEIETQTCTIASTNTINSGPPPWICTDIILRRTTEVMTGTAYARPLRVYWHSDDLAQFPSAYASSLALQIKVPFGDGTGSHEEATPQTTGLEAANQNKPDSQASGLDPGAIAGIAVGILTFVVLGVISLLYLWRRRIRQQRLRHPGRPEMEGGSRGLKRFVGGEWRAEQDGTSQPVEVESRSVRVIPGPPVELDGMLPDRGV